MGLDSYDCSGFDLDEARTELKGLRARIEKLAEDFERPYEGFNGQITPKGVARRLREILNEKPARESEGGA
jgi:hypothetical protein